MRSYLHLHCGHTHWAVPDHGFASPQHLCHSLQGQPQSFLVKMVVQTPVKLYSDPLKSLSSLLATVPVHQVSGDPEAMADLTNKWGDLRAQLLCLEVAQSVSYQGNPWESSPEISSLPALLLPLPGVFHICLGEIPHLLLWAGLLMDIHCLPSAWGLCSARMWLEVISLCSLLPCQECCLPGHPQVQICKIPRRPVSSSVLSAPAESWCILVRGKETCFSPTALHFVPTPQSWAAGALPFMKLIEQTGSSSLLWFF